LEKPRSRGAITFSRMTHCRLKSTQLSSIKTPEPATNSAIVAAESVIQCFTTVTKNLKSIEQNKNIIWRNTRKGKIQFN
jgi:hypothetical protein